MKIRFFKSLRNTAQSFLEQYKQKNPATYAAALQVVGGLLIVDGFIGIDNPFGGRKRPGILGAFIGIIVSIGLIFSGPIMSKISGLDKMTASTQGEVVSVSEPRQECHTDSEGRESCDSVCDMEVQYTVAGKAYNSKPSVSSGSGCQHTEGQTITIKYNPGEPSAWTTQEAQDNMSLFAKIAVLVGVVISLISLFTFVIRFLSIFFGWKLLRQGRTLVKTLPEGTNLTTISSEIKQNFLQTAFNGNGLSSTVTNMVTVSKTDATLQPTTPMTAAPAPQPPTTPQSPQVPSSKPTTTSSEEDSTNHTSS